MKATEIKRAVDEGLTVHWMNPGYEVIRGGERDQYFICIWQQTNQDRIRPWRQVLWKNFSDSFVQAQVLRVFLPSAGDSLLRPSERHTLSPGFRMIGSCERTDNDCELLDDRDGSKDL
jgi:hypothetical protein